MKILNHYASIAMKIFQNFIPRKQNHIIKEISKKKSMKVCRVGLAEDKTP